MEEILLTDNGKTVLAYLQEHDHDWVGKDLINVTGVKGIYPVLNSLIHHQLVESAGTVIRNFTNIKGETKPKEYKAYRITELGRAFEIK